MHKYCTYVVKLLYRKIYEGYVFTKPKYTGSIFWCFRENACYTRQTNPLGTQQKMPLPPRPCKLILHFIEKASLKVSALYSFCIAYVRSGLFYHVQ